MLVSEFYEQLNKLKLAFGERQFPEVREQALWQRYKAYTPSDFAKAVDAVLIAMPQPSAILSVLDDNLRGSVRELHAENFQENPNAAQLAKKYMPSIERLLKNCGGLPLPYDPKKRQA